MPTFVKVAEAGDIPPGTVKPVKVNGMTIALCNVGGTFYALGDECIHRGGPLSEGYIENGHLECPWHGWPFDVKTGAVVMNPKEGVPTYEVKVEGSDILISV